MSEVHGLISRRLIPLKWSNTFNFSSGLSPKKAGSPPTFAPSTEHLYATPSIHPVKTKRKKGSRTTVPLYAQVIEVLLFIDLPGP